MAEYLVYSPDCIDVIGTVTVNNHVNTEVEASNALDVAIKQYKDHVAVAPVTLQ